MVSFEGDNPSTYAKSRRAGGFKFEIYEGGGERYSHRDADHKALPAVQLG